MKIKDKITEAKDLIDSILNFDAGREELNVVDGVLNDAYCEINRLRALLGTAEERLQLLDKMSADHILERSEIFDDKVQDLDDATILIVKRNFREWHADNIAKPALKLLGEPIEEIENED